MPIVIPGPHLFSSVKLRTAKKAVSRSGGRNVNAMLNLTPMIDMFVVLTIFLLMTFSTSGEILFIQKDIELPTATHSEELEQSPAIIIGGGQVVAEGKGVGRMDDIAEDENFEIAELSEILNNLKKQFQQLHPNQTFSGKIIIQGDKSVEFRVLKKVMFTCTSVGYSNINFAILPVGGGGEAPKAEGEASEST
ncbi:MAG: biopolymer transporter ExbD [Deltaproteobacteria bacterium]|nr:biopolymer transporter ExbD [Deltaproteobacteria bacterium]